LLATSLDDCVCHSLKEGESLAHARSEGGGDFHTCLGSAS
jgi:hypothetical protein